MPTYKGPTQEPKAAAEDARPVGGALTLEGLASRLLGGVRALSVVAGTGAGAVKLKGHADARQLLTGLVRGRELLLTPPQRRELDGLVARCKVVLLSCVGPFFGPFPCTAAGRATMLAQASLL